MNGRKNALFRWPSCFLAMAALIFWRIASVNAICHGKKPYFHNKECAENAFLLDELCPIIGDGAVVEKIRENAPKLIVERIYGADHALTIKSKIIIKTHRSTTTDTVTATVVQSVDVPIVHETDLCTVTSIVNGEVAYTETIWAYHTATACATKLDIGIVFHTLTHCATIQADVTTTCLGSCPPPAKTSVFVETAYEW